MASGVGSETGVSSREQEKNNIPQIRVKIDLNILVFISCFFVKMLGSALSHTIWWKDKGPFPH